MSDDDAGDDQSENEGDQQGDEGDHPQRDADPFEELGKDVAGRKGDPFEELGDGPGDSPMDDPQSGGSDSGPAWFENPNEEQSSSGRGTDESVDDHGPRDPLGERGADESEDDHGPTGPLGEQESAGTGQQPEGEKRATQDPSRMTFDVGRRDVDGTTMSGPLGDVGTREGDPFEEMGRTFEEQEGGPIDPDVVWQELTSAESRGSVGDAQERTFADVSKHSYCEQCEYFSEPPDIHCSHEGTEIVEYLDMETVRVVDCPIVAERRELRDEE